MAAFLRIRVNRSTRVRILHAGSALAAASLLLAASSCRTPGSTARNNAPLPEQRVTSRVTESPRPSAPPSAAPDQNVYHAVVSDAGGTVIEPLGYEAEQTDADRAVPRGGSVPVQPVATTTAIPIVHAPEERLPVGGPPASPEFCPPALPGYCPPGAQSPCPPLVGPYALPRVWPDEYICDGGDRGQPVHFHGPVRQGLETEDTIGEFVDENGNRQVRPSSRACVYAPRFASVRTISQPVLGYAIDKPAGAHDGVALAGLDRELGPGTQAQIDQLNGLNMRSRASGLGADAGDSSVGQVETTEQHLKIQNTYEDRNFVAEGQFQQGTEAALAYGIQLAAVWTRDLNPIIVAADEAGHQVSGQFKAEEYVGAEDQRPPGELEVLKTADRAFAHPGDEITFTIRFINGGGRALYQVRIIDHLTPRLEYVPGSAVSELDGRLDLTNEDDGTQILTFELAEPLEGGQSGEITFKAMLR